jgi:hypothetical protein
MLVLRNYHRFLGGPEVVQALDTALAAGKRDRTFVVVLSPVVQIPVELVKAFVVIDHDLPGRDQLASIARGVATEPGELPDGNALGAVLDAAAGLTRLEAENAFSLSPVRHGRRAPDVLWEIKSGMLKKSGLLTLHRGGEAFAGLGRLEALKSFCARALGAETGRPTLILDVGALLGSLVGQSEANVRQALRLVDAMAPCVVMIDEVKKALAGAASGGQTDSGVAARMFASFLSWLSDHESDAFVVCTANDVSRLPAEFGRVERFDGCFFLDLPGPRERERIWAIYPGRYGLDPGQPRPRDHEFTGAEVKACCRLAALPDVPLIDAARNIVPVAVTAGESVERLRSWAGGRCLSADRPGIYTRGNDPARPGRNVRRGDPSAN